MVLTDVHAEQIADLLNERNQLTVQYNAQLVQSNKEKYLFRLSKTGEVAACVEVKKVQWYQTEILHLTVAKSEVRKGHAKALLCEAERISRAHGARLLQCTIREGNNESRLLFEGFGFIQVSIFNNPSSGNNVGVFQKVLSRT